MMSTKAKLRFGGGDKLNQIGCVFCLWSGATIAFG
jgi:hypothetical protein